MQPPPPNPNPPQPPEAISDFEDEGLGLGEYLAILLEFKWLIAGVTLVAVLIGAAKAFIDHPIYRADALLQIEEQASSPFSALDQFSAMYEQDVPVTAEMEILRSRMVLGKAVDNLELDVIAEPLCFPVIGKAIARRYRGPAGSVASPRFGQTQYAWGGEEIEVETLSVPPGMIGESLTLTAEKEGRYRLSDESGEVLLKGEVGKLSSRDLEGEDEPLRLFVSVLKSRPGTRFKIARLARMAAIRRLKAGFSVSEKGKYSGILEMTLTASDARSARDVLNEIANIYVRQNVEQRSAEAEKTLEFLEQQLPKQKEQLEAAVTALNAYRLQKGSIDLTIETQAVLKGIVDRETSLTLLQHKRDELRQKFTPSHPTVKTLDSQIARLTRELASLNKEVADLPDTQQVVLSLSRDVQVSTELYTALLNSAQELRLAKAGTVGNVRIVDYAVLPSGPIKPQKTRILLISAVLGLFLGTALAFVRRGMHHGIEDPDLAEKQLGIPVYATIPHSEMQVKLSQGGWRGKARRRPRRKGSLVLAMAAKDDQAVESLRSLRTTLHFALLEAKNNIIMISGSSPGVGKTFVTANLGAVLANTGKKILLIDADLRKGYLHQYLGVPRDNGLSDLITGSIDLAQAIRNTDCENLDVIPTGEIPPNPSELLLHERFNARLEEASQAYDHILIDSPPILAVTDAAIVGRMAGATLMVVKAGEHPLKELEQSIKRLKQAGVNLRGMVFNDVKLLSHRYRYGSGYGKYVYQYTYKKK